MNAIAELERTQVTPLTLRPLQPTIGAEITGIDLRSPLSDAHRDEIKTALLKYKVVFFRDQQIDRRSTWPSPSDLARSIRPLIRRTS